MLITVLLYSGESWMYCRAVLCAQGAEIMLGCCVLDL